MWFLGKNSHRTSFSALEFDFLIKIIKKEKSEMKFSFNRAHKCAHFDVDFLFRGVAGNFSGEGG